MKTQNNSDSQANLLEKILDNAIELPLESQNSLLMLAKGMAFTHECLTKREGTSEPTKPPSNNRLA